MRICCCSRLKPPDVSQKDKYFLPLAVLPFFVCEDFLYVDVSFSPLPRVLCTYIAISFLHLRLIPAFSFPPFFVPKVLNFSSVGWGVWYMETQISDIFILPAFLVPSPT